MKRTASIVVRLDVQKIPDIPTFLKTNTDIFDFSKSYEYIRQAHEITDSSDQTTVSQQAEFDSIKFHEFRQLIIAEGIDFERTGYQHYVELSTDQTTGKLVVKKTNYDIKTTCYSLPFIRSLFQYYSFEGYDTLSFVKVKLGGVDTIAISVVDPSGVSVSYYDYSQQPLAGAASLSLFFNPL